MTYRIMFSGMKIYFETPSSSESESDMNNNNNNQHQPQHEHKNEKIIIEEILYDTKEKKMKSIQMKIDPITEDFNIKKLWQKSLSYKYEQFLYCLNSSRLFSFYFFEDDRYIGNSNFDEIFHVPCLILRYLIVQNYLILCVSDIQAFLLTFVWIHKYGCSSKDKLFEHTNLQDPRAVHLAAIFLAGYENLYFSNAVCGSPISDDGFNLENVFVGHFFQHAYENVHLKNKDFLKNLHSKKFSSANLVNIYFILIIFL